MSKNSLFSSLALISLSCTGLYADSSETQYEENVSFSLNPFKKQQQPAVTQQPTTPDNLYCDDRGPKPMRLGLRHIEGRGIGYDQGYTTLEGFFAPSDLWGDAWGPFLDLRGHVFNDGKFAGNAGTGIRYLTDSRVWGGNIYYDYRSTRHQHYNQISMGLESLGEIWDFRINGYLPVGDMTSRFFDLKRHSFQGHNVFISRKREFAMKGVNAEVGAHVDNVKNFPFYFAAGPYYLEGRGKSTWGGELRAAMDIFEYVRIEGSTSYDNTFGWIGQGQLSVMLHFGGKRQVKQRKDIPCSTTLALRKRTLQNVDRREIIPTLRERKKSIAIDPLTGRPYHILFVNNTSSSDGTFESPYPTLVMAQNNSQPGDIIYVFSGNGSPYDMIASGASGFSMKDNQRLFGSGTAHELATQFGTVTIPVLTSNLPTVTNTVVSSNVITLARNCEVAGMHITGTEIQHGIAGEGTLVSGIIRDNWIEISSTTTGGSGILIENTSAANTSVLIVNNRISQVFNNAPTGIILGNSGAGLLTGLVVGNNISGIHDIAGNFSRGILLFNDGSGIVELSILRNNISDIFSTVFSAGIQASNDGSRGTFQISDNSISQVSDGILLSNASQSGTVLILKNRISSATSQGIAVNNSLGNTCLTLRDNIAPPNITLTQSGGTFTLDSSSGNNTPAPTTSGTITLEGTCSQ